jgi:hypothetical protein
MRVLSTAEVTALSARRIVGRDLVWITAKNRSTGDPASYGFWNDVGTVSINVVDGRTGAINARSFYGLHASLTVGRIPLVSDITVRELEITLPHLDSIVNEMVRTHDVRGAPIQVYRLFLDPDTRAAISTAKARWVGYVDTAPIETPSEGQEGSVRIVCVSVTRELTRRNHDVRSHESQLRRNNLDFFYKDTAAVGEWEVFWGKHRGKPRTIPQDEDRRRRGSNNDRWP